MIVRIITNHNGNIKEPLLRKFDVIDALKIPSRSLSVDLNKGQKDH